MHAAQQRRLGLFKVTLRSVAGQQRLGFCGVLTLPACTAAIMAGRPPPPYIVIYRREQSELLETTLTAQGPSWWLQPDAQPKE